MSSGFAKGDKIRVTDAIDATGIRPGYQGEVKGHVPAGTSGEVEHDDGGENIQAKLDLDVHTKDTVWTIPRDSVELEDDGA